MNRRKFIVQAGAAVAGGTLAPFARAWPQSAPDVNLEIAPLALEIAPRKIVHTVAYNGRVPGPLIRWPEGKPITIEVTNRTNIPELVHSHGLWIPSEMDGSDEEGTPMIAPGAQFRYAFTPRQGSAGITRTSLPGTTTSVQRILASLVAFTSSRKMTPGRTIRKFFSRCTIGTRFPPRAATRRWKSRTNTAP